MVFQDPFASLNRRRRVADAVALPLVGSGMTRQQRQERVTEVLSRVGLGEEYLNYYPHQLSGGQAQRVAIARALCPDPDVLILDEAVSALDVSVQAQILNLLRRLKLEMGLTYLLISHDLSVVRYMCERMLVMQGGRIVEEGDRESVFRRPTDEYTKALIAAIPRLGGPLSVAGGG
jgi:peptide/nickel transport system ATP-binding protein